MEAPFSLGFATTLTNSGDASHVSPYLGAGVCPNPVRSQIGPNVQVVYSTGLGAGNGERKWGRRGNGVGEHFRAYNVNPRGTEKITLTPYNVAL